MKKIISATMIIIQMILIAASNSVQLSAQPPKGSFWVIMKKDSSTISVKSTAMDIVKRDTLWLIQDGKTTKLPVDSIIQLKHVRKGKVVNGLTIGGAIGAATGAVLAVAGLSSSKGYTTDDLAITAAGLAVGAGVGALIGAAGSDYEVYELNYMTLFQKSKLIRSHCRR